MKKSLLLGLGAVAMAFAAGAGIAINNTRSIRADAESASPTTRTLYLCSNWDWGTPRIHFWGDGWADSVWPLGTRSKYSVVSSTVEGDVYSWDVPINTRAFLIQNGNNAGQQTQDFSLGTNWGDYSTNGFYFQSDNGDKVVASNLSFLSDGYYLTGDANFATAVGASTTSPWSFSSSVKMYAATNEGYAASYIVSAGASNFECKVRKITNGLQNGWIGNDNFQMSASTTYEVKVNTGGASSSYSVGVHIDTFSDAFLADLGPICGSSNPDIEDPEWSVDHKTSLKAIWSTHKNRFENKLVDGEPAKFTVDSESGSGVQRAATLYHHCISRYGGENPEEDLASWSNVPTISASKLVLGLEASDNSMSALIAIAASAALVSVAGYFFLRRRKQD